MYAQAQNQRWPDELAQVEKFVYAGKLKHPNRPQEEIGFEYIRPTCPAVWQPATGKRVMVYERFEAWPGEVTVGFTDGSTEILSDPQRLQHLIAAARAPVP